MFYFLAISSIMFAAGLYGVLTRRTLSRMLTSMYVMFASAAFNCIIFNSLIRGDDSNGYFFALAIIAAATAVMMFGQRIDKRLRVDSTESREGLTRVDPSCNTISASPEQTATDS